MSSEAETFACADCGEDVPTANKLMHAIQCERHSNKDAASFNQEEKSPAEKSQGNDEALGTGLATNEEEPAATTADGNLTSSEGLGGVSRESNELHSESSEQEQDGAESMMLVTCEFCEIDVPLPALSEHAYTCGNRTDVCESCMCYVRLCDFPSHRSSGCTVGATASAMRSEAETEHAPLLQPSTDEPHHRERQVRLAEPEVSRWAPVVIAAVGVGAAVAFSAMTRRR